MFNGPSCISRNKLESDLLKRRGTFSISETLINSNPEAVVEALKDILIVRVENDFMTKSLMYAGYSSRFDLLDIGELTPEYVADVKDENGVITTTWRREKEYTERDVKAIIRGLKLVTLKT